MTTSSPSPGKPAKRGLTFLISVLALVVAVLAFLLAWRANSRAGEALDKLAGPAPTTAAASAPGNAPTTGSTPQPTASDEPTDGSTAAAAPELNAQTKYTVKYADQPLRIAAECGASVNVDLDEPRVQVDSEIAEFSYFNSCGSNPGPYITFKPEVDGTEADTDAMQPTDCGDRIRTSPLPTGNHPVRKGQLYCVTTSWTAAQSSARTWKMATFLITGIGQDGALTVKASAWDIPQ
jgi:hypothetical protein